jgi:hypothetical protein
VIDGARLTDDLLRETRATWHALVIRKDNAEVARRIGDLIRSLVQLKTGRYELLAEATQAARNISRDSWRKSDQ